MCSLQLLFQENRVNAALISWVKFFLVLIVFVWANNEYAIIVSVNIEEQKCNGDKTDPTSVEANYPGAIRVDQYASSTARLGAEHSSRLKHKLFSSKPLVLRILHKTNTFSVVNLVFLFQKLHFTYFFRKSSITLFFLISWA